MLARKHDVVAAAAMIERLAAWRSKRGMDPQLVVAAASAAEEDPPCKADDDDGSECTVVRHEAACTVVLRRHEALPDDASVPLEPPLAAMLASMQPRLLEGGDRAGRPVKVRSQRRPPCHPDWPRSAPPSSSTSTPGPWT